MKNMSLAMKIGLGFGTLIALSAVLGTVAVWNMHHVKQGAISLAEEYVPEVSVANHIERNALLAMYGIRGYGFTEEEQYLQDGRKKLQDVKKYMAEAAELAARSAHLVKLKEAVGQFQTNVNAYESLIDQTVVRNQAIADCRKTLDDSAGRYMESCNDYLAGQNETMRKELAEGAAADKLQERLNKINIMNDIIDLGNATRIACFRSQALRNPEIIREADRNFKQIEQKLSDLGKITRQEADLKHIEETQAAANSYKTAMNGLLDNWLALQELAKQRNNAGENVLESAQQTAVAGMDQTNEVAQNSVAALKSASLITVTGLILAAIIGVVVAIVIARGIMRPFHNIFKGLKTFSTAELNATGETFRRITDGLTEGVAQVNDAAGQVSSASQQLAEGASEQASSLEETSSALEQMAAMTRTNAANAKEANELAATAHTAAEQGDKTMTAINESSDQISKIIKVIEEIAFQTNLLALNAAVEAARAGEHGKGFAVVADEVRNLAQRAAQAAKETTGLIENSVNKSREGAEAIKAIVGGVAKVTDLINGIAKASDEQALGVEQVNTAVAQMDKVTQQNASGAEESASAAEELSAQAAATKGLVDELIVLVQGHQNVSSHIGHHTPKELKHLPGKKSPARKKTDSTQCVTASVTHGDFPSLDDEKTSNF